MTTTNTGENPRHDGKRAFTCMGMIKRFIARLPRDKLFTTRDCVVFGQSGTVNRCLSRLVKSGWIIRVAYGVFLRRELFARQRLPSAMEVAMVKAKAFGKIISRHGADLAIQLGLRPRADQDRAYFVSGRTSSFFCYLTNERIRLIGRSPRKLHANTRLPGHVVRALWQLGFCYEWEVAKAERFCKKAHLEELRLGVRWMPAWIGQYFVDRPLSRGAWNKVEPA